MKYRISDLIDDYEQGKIELKDCHITSAARIQQLTMARLGLNVTPIRRGKKLGRTLCIAAVLVMALAVTAVAVYQYTVKDLVMELPQSPEFTPAETAQSEASGEAASTEAQSSAANQLFSAGEMENGTPLYFYSLAGYDKESPEYKAQQEWLYYFFHTEKVYDVREPLSYSAPHQLYGVGDRNMADKLDALAEKYDLELVQAEYHLKGAYYDGDAGQTVESVCDILGMEPFILSALDIHTGVLYNEGSFEVNGDLTVPGREDTVFVNFYCAMDGTLPVFNIRGEADRVEYKTVTTTGGVTADLALGQNYSMIFVTMDNCHMLVDVSGGQANPASQPLTMEALEAIADCFDYEKVNKFDRAQRSDTVSALFAETLENTSWMNEDLGREAEDVFALLGDYGITALPKGYSFASSGYSPPEESLDSMWAAETGGGASASISVLYDLPGDENDWYAIDLNYARYWQDAEMTTVNNRLGFDPENILLVEVDETHCTVNGYEAYYYIGDSNQLIYLYWLDTDRELVFSLIVPKTFTPEQAIAMAESVQ